MVNGNIILESVSDHLETPPPPSRRNKELISKVILYTVQNIISMELTVYHKSLNKNSCHAIWILIEIDPVGGFFGTTKNGIFALSSGL
jgi:hypothetical protein